MTDEIKKDIEDLLQKYQDIRRYQVCNYTQSTPGGFKVQGKIEVLKELLKSR